MQSICFLLYELVLFFYQQFSTFIFALQNDDVKIYDNDSDQYWKTFWVSNDIAVKHGWRNSKILEAYSPGLGKLTASLSYPGGADDKKEVIVVS